MINPLNIKHKNLITLVKLKSLLPPKILLPIFFSMFFDAIAGSLGGSFFNIWLDAELQPTYYTLAIVLAIPGITALFASTGFSIFSDKTSRRKELLLMGRVALILQYLFLIFFNGNIWSILGILVSFSFFIQIYYIITNTLATIICPPNRKGEIASFLMLFSGAGYTIGSIFSGLVYESFHEKYGLIINLALAACFILLSGVVVIFSPSQTLKTNNNNNHNFILDNKKGEQIENYAASNGLKFVEASPNKYSSTTQKSQSLAAKNQTTESSEEGNQSSRIATFFEILKRPQIIALLVSIGILDFAIGPFSLLGSIYLNKVVHLSFQQLGYIGSVSSVIGLMTLFIIGKFLDRFGRKRFLLVPITVYPFYFLMFYLLRFYPITIAFLWVLPIYPFRAPTTIAMMSDMTTENERARGMTLLQFESVFAYNFGAIIGGLIAELTPMGLFIAPLFPAVIALIGIGFAYLTLKETNTFYLQNRQKEAIIKK